MKNASVHDLHSALIAAIRSHWRRIKANLRDAPRNKRLENVRCYRFEAPLRSQRHALAREFYSIDHASQILSLTDRELAKQIKYFAKIAVAQARRDFDGEPQQQRSFIKSLVTAEYVLVENSENLGGWHASGYPAESAYDDWYERSVGASMPYTGEIMKSTGEDFTASEEESLYQNVLLTCLEDPEFWHAHAGSSEPNRICVQITPIERGYYVDWIEDDLAYACKNGPEQIVSVLHDLRMAAPFIADEGRFVVRLDRLLASVKKLDCDSLLNRTCRLLRATATSDEILVEAKRILQKKLMLSALEPQSRLANDSPP